MSWLDDPRHRLWQGRYVAATAFQPVTSLTGGRYRSGPEGLSIVPPDVKGVIAVNWQRSERHLRPGRKITTRHGRHHRQAVRGNQRRPAENQFVRDDSIRPSSKDRHSITTADAS